MVNTTVVHNLSADTITVRRVIRKQSTPIATLTQNSLTIARHPYPCLKLALIERDEKAEDDVKDAALDRNHVDSAVFCTKASCRSRSWTSLKLPHPCRWRVYQIKNSRCERTLTILSNRDMSSYLADVPDSVSLSACVLPGTHDTMAVYGWPFSQCQSMTLADQLAAGIRVLDIRLAVVNSALTAYHGWVSQRVSFQDILATVHAFLTATLSSLETLVMFIKQEDFQTTPPIEFSKLVRKELLNGPGGMSMWYLENRVPTLGEVRGKVVLLSRFGESGDGWENSKGLYPDAWPDNRKEGFTTFISDTFLRVQDWYGIPSFLDIPEKFSLSTPLLLPPPPGSPSSTLSITYFSAANPPWATPQAVALGEPGVDGMNTRVGLWMLERLANDKTRVRGWALMDFCDPDLVGMLTECNFRWRVHGEEGWV